MTTEEIQQYEDPEWVDALVRAFLDINVDKLSISQRKLLRETYFEKLNSGLKPKQAIEQALEIVLCFSIE